MPGGEEVGDISMKKNPPKTPQTGAREKIMPFSIRWIFAGVWLVILFWIMPAFVMKTMLGFMSLAFLVWNILLALVDDKIIDADKL
jgi:hypothetical protein